MLQKCQLLLVLLLFLWPLFIQLKVGMDGGTRKLPQRTWMSLELRHACRSRAVTIPHTCGSAYSLRISSHPNPSLRWREGYYPHFTGEETRAQGRQVLTWPRSCGELSCSQVCLNSFDFSSKSGVGSLLPEGPPQTGSHTGAPSSARVWCCVPLWRRLGEHHWAQL